MAESVYKVIELVGTSTESWERAAAAAISHDSVLVPTSSITLYTLSAMLFSFLSGVSSSLSQEPCPFTTRLRVLKLGMQQQQRERLGD